jgi:uroporphyrinogen-III decarboxylase
MIKPREKMLAAMSGNLDGDFPVVVCYTGILLRDHWEQISTRPWWILEGIDLPGRLAVEEDFQEKLGPDWVTCVMARPRDWRENHEIRCEGGRVFVVDKTTGEKNEIHRPPQGGNKISMPQKPRIESRRDARNLVEITEEKVFRENGSLDLVRLFKERFGREKLLFSHVGTPFWSVLMSYFGLGGMLRGLFRMPDLIHEILGDITRAKIENIRAYSSEGVECFWIEECLTSASEISKTQYKDFVLPYTKRLIDEIRRLGGKSVYYICGDVRDRMDMVIETGPDCISLEESKKNFEIDIEWVDQEVDGRSCIFGNLDSIGVLQDGTREELRSEIRRQIDIGRKHGKFVMSLGSPVTPKTPIERVREYINISREESTPRP